MRITQQVTLPATRSQVDDVLADAGRLPTLSGTGGLAAGLEFSAFVEARADGQPALAESHTLGSFALPLVLAEG
jgi:hypothetical protein